MKRTLTYALAAVLGAFVVAPVFAQDNFPDVPENHWAFDALSRLKKAGILVGYPDGLFRGGRPASRYEMAVAINAAYQNLHTVTDGLQSQIDALKAMMGGSGSVSQSDLQALKDQLANLQNQVSALSGLSQDVANLRRLADTFQKELQALGVDVEAMKRDLGDLSDRVTKLEKRKPVVDITGDANWWLGAGQGMSGEVGLDMDGRYNGISNAGVPGIPASTSSLANDLTIMHEIALNLAGTNETGPKWAGTIVIGDMLGGYDTAGGFGNQSQPNYGYGYTENAEDIYIQDFGIKWATSIASLKFNVDAGRVAFKVSPYILQRESRDEYFKNSRWDNGDYYIDGGILGFNFGSAKLDLVGGRASSEDLAGSLATNGGGVHNSGESINGTPLDPIVSGGLNGPFTQKGAPVPITVDRVAGAVLNAPIFANGNVNLAYLLLDTETPLEVGLNGGFGLGASIDRIADYGGSVDLNVGPIKLSGTAAQTNLMDNNTMINDQYSGAYQVKAALGEGAWGVWGDYRQVDANFLAPGDWGRLGILRNPVNIKGFQAGAHLRLASALTLYGNGEWDKGLEDKFAGSTGFNSGTNINKYGLDLGWKPSSMLGLHVGYEDTKFSNMSAITGTITPQPAATPALGFDPEYKWTTFGVDYGLSDGAKLMIQYQLSDISGDFVIPGAVGNNYKGGFLTTQLSVKF